jgi:hypothetical protein
LLSSLLTHKLQTMLGCVVVRQLPSVTDTSCRRLESHAILCSSGYVSFVAKVHLRGLLSCEKPTEIGTVHKSVCVSRRSIPPRFIYGIRLYIPRLAISHALVGWYLKDVQFIARCFMSVLLLSFISFLYSFLSFSLRFQAETDIFPLLTASRRPPPTSLAPQ